MFNLFIRYRMSQQLFEGYRHAEGSEEGNGLINAFFRRKIIIPFGDDHIEAGDTVILIARASSIGALEDALGEGEAHR